MLAHILKLKNSKKVKKQKAKDLIKKLYLVRNKNQAKNLQRFFKTGPGQYGEGDFFLGISVPEQRKISKNFYDLALLEVRKLLKSRIHEHRLCGLIILIEKYKKSQKKEEIINFYLKNIDRINNWDLVDISCPRILGDYLLNKDKKILYRLAASKNLWERRISIISTMQLIHHNQLKDAIKISEILLKDNHDLIHKAVGWTLREVGKRSLRDLEDFLKNHKNEMPRTALRYAIEKFPESKRKKYLKS